MIAVERLLARRTITPSGCWEIAGQPHRRYGQLAHGTYAHRLAYEMWIGPIPAGMLVCHRCDNPPCFNPAHLFLGSKRDNLVDAALKGRWRPSPRRTQCKAGHDLSGSNVYLHPKRGSRLCRECQRAAGRRWKARARGASTEQDQAAVELLARRLG
jgi:hypothetical protein